MKTVVYQSYRTHNVPGWISGCMDSIRSWASLHGFEYKFFDDSMFAYAPQWYREKVKNNILLVSDLARLEIARELLKGGYERTIWVDADVLAFAPAEWTIEVDSQYAFCREIWVRKKTRREVLRGFCTALDTSPYVFERKVNNAVAVFVQGNALLDFYIHAAQLRVRNMPAEHLSPSDVGTGMLTRLHQGLLLPLLKTVGLFSPLITRHVALEESRRLSEYGRALPHAIYATNFCSSLVGGITDGVKLTEALVVEAMERLLLTKGQIVNRFCS